MGKAVRLSDNSRKVFKHIWRNRWIYLFLLPGVLHMIIFDYWPMYGVTLAFKEYKYTSGILGSPWAHPWYKYFVLMANDKMFWKAFMNTFRMGFWYIVIGFPAPIILSILLNEVGNRRYKKVLQTVYTIPNFFSWVVVGGIMMSFLSSEGFLNIVLRAIGSKGYDFLSNKNLIRPLLYATEVWKSAGWSAIIYLAAISGIDPELYEAAEIDGANRFQRIWHITWPCIKSTAVVLLVLAFGNILNSGFDQILNMVNPVVQNEAEILDTYIYRITFKSAPNYGLSTAMGLLKSVINLVFLLAANKIAKLFGEDGVI